MSIEEEQKALCERYAVTYTPAPDWDNSGYALETEDQRPIHGLRHPITTDTTGWFIWCGEYSADKDFFKPVHTAHIKESLPEIATLLGLPPGFRFLVTQGRQDVWFDSTLLNV